MKYSPQFSAVSALGNVFSNGAEELIYRGIIFSATVLIFRNSWLSVTISAFAFGVGHRDLPYLIQTYIVLVGMTLGGVYLRTKSLVAPYIAHLIADILADSFFH